MQLRVAPHNDMLFYAFSVRQNENWQTKAICQFFILFSTKDIPLSRWDFSGVQREHGLKSVLSLAGSQLSVHLVQSLLVQIVYDRQAYELKDRAEEVKTCNEPTHIVCGRSGLSDSTEL